MFIFNLCNVALSWVKRSFWNEWTKAHEPKYFLSYFFFSPEIAKKYSCLIDCSLNIFALISIANHRNLNSAIDILIVYSYQRMSLLLLKKLVFFD